jgi:hypothetical protein
MVNCTKWAKTKKIAKMFDNYESINGDEKIA